MPSAHFPERTDRSSMAALAALFRAGPVALLTGAGVSTDSGIPDYRGAGTPPPTPMNIDQFQHDLKFRQWFWIRARLGTLGTSSIAPNAGHQAIARLETAGWLTGVITQNVDGLHRGAGSVNLAELHGNGSVFRCALHHRFTREEVFAWFDLANPRFTQSAQQNSGHSALRPAHSEHNGTDQHGNISNQPTFDSAFDPAAEQAAVNLPVCPACGGMLRPDVVYFGEHAEPSVFAHAERIVHAASALLVAGSSLAVNTGIRLVHRAEKQGIPLAVINRGPTAIDQRTTLSVRIEAGTSQTLTTLERLLGS